MTAYRHNGEMIVSFSFRLMTVTKRFFAWKQTEANPMTKAKNQTMRNGRDENNGRDLPKADLIYFDLDPIRSPHLIMHNLRVGVDHYQIGGTLGKGGTIGFSLSDGTNQPSQKVA